MSAASAYLALHEDDKVKGNWIILCYFKDDEASVLTKLCADEKNERSLFPLQFQSLKIIVDGILMSFICPSIIIERMPLGAFEVRGDFLSSLGLLCQKLLDQFEHA